MSKLIISLIALILILAYALIKVRGNIFVSQADTCLRLSNKLVNELSL